MSAEQSDLKAGGEGEKSNESVEKTESAAKSVSAAAVKSRSLSKTLSPAGVKSRSVTETESASTVRNGPSRGSSERRGSKTSAIGPSSTKSSGEKMVTVSKSYLRKSSQEMDTKSSEEGVPEVIIEETEEQLEDEGKAGIRRGSPEPAGSARPSVSFLGPGAHPSSSVVEMTLMRTNTMAQSGVWSVTSGTLVSRMYSGVIESVASLHAAGLTTSDPPASTATTAKRKSQAQPGSQESRHLDRSVWKDPEVLELLGKMRLDALGENVIWSREGSEETLPEGLITQFDVLEAEKPEKVIDQLMAYKEEVRSLGEELSQAGSLITTISPSEIPVPELEAVRTVSMGDAALKTTGSWVESAEPSKESSVVVSEPARLPSPVFCDVSKLACFTTKEEISVKELSVCRSDVKVNVEPTINVVQVKFRLVTGQILKRIYDPDVIFLDTLCELSQILCVPKDCIQLFFKSESLNLNADVRICKDPGDEVLVDADVCPALLFCLVEKGIISFDDDRALELFLLQQVPHVPEKKPRHIRPVLVPLPIPQPTSFIPGLVDHRKRDSAINSELERQLELANCVRCIQSSFRCYLSKRTFPSFPRKEQASQEPIKESPALFTKNLYSMLGKWWRHEADDIKSSSSAAAKIARLFNLLLREINYMRHIEKHRCKLKDRMRRIDKIAANQEDYTQGFLLLFALKSALVECSKDKTKLFQHLKCKKCALNRRAILTAISRDKIIGGNLKGCNTLPCSNFPLYTETTRIYNCGKCQNLDNLGRDRRDLTAVRSLMEDVRVEEMKLCATSWLPYIMQDRDFATLLNLWHNVSALSGISCDLRFVRWDPDEEWSPWNTVLLTREEARVHRADVYGQDFVDTVRARHLTAKWTFRNLIESAKVMRGKFGMGTQDRQDVEDFQGLRCFQNEHSFQASQDKPEMCLPERSSSRRDSSK